VVERVLIDNKLYDIAGRSSLPGSASARSPRPSTV